VPRSWKHPEIVEAPSGATAATLAIEQSAPSISAAGSSSWFGSFLDLLQTQPDHCADAFEESLPSEADGNFIRFNSTISSQSSIAVTLMVALPCPPEPQDESTDFDYETLGRQKLSLECKDSAARSEDSASPTSPVGQGQGLFSQVKKLLRDATIYDKALVSESHSSDSTTVKQKKKLICKRKCRTPASVVNLGLETSISSMRTKLKYSAPAFNPMQTDSQLEIAARNPFHPMKTDSKLDIAARNLYLSLVSKVQTPSAELQKGQQGISPASISIRIQEGPSCFSNGYDAVLHAQRVFEEITSQSDNVKLLSNKVKEEADGYSLEAAMACLPCGAEDKFCWDLQHKGWCPRGGKCSWYHPRESDIGKINVRVRCAGHSLGILRKQPAVNHPPGRFNLPLNALLI
jgi:hypothetical protein